MSSIFLSAFFLAANARVLFWRYCDTSLIGQFRKEGDCSPSMASHSLLLQSHHHCLLMRFGSAAMARILADFDISELKVLVKG